MELEPRKPKVKTLLLAVSCAFLLSTAVARPQDTGFNYFYRVSFKDKGENNVSDYLPLDLLSQRAVDRRIKGGIAVPDYRDLPVSKNYLNQVRSLGLTLHCTSKWMNTALFKTKEAADINGILILGFVKDVTEVKRPAGKSDFSNKLDFIQEQADVPPFDMPVSMLNGYPLRNSGLDGTGVLIAVLDGGFYRADLISSLSHLRQRNGISGTRDFVTGNEDVYSYSSHGTAVLSILAGRIPGYIEGTAPGAEYWLLRTEDTATEFPVEEDFWAAGAEYADSIGADIISSSLGYYMFDDPSLSYKYADMDGNSAFVTRAADIAASKGILVVASAGNERNKEWIRIIAPSDGDSVLCAGAVDGSGIISTFSSAGPSADGRIKPDNVAQGVSVVIQTDVYSLARGNGTSFSCPVLSGFCACLIQAFPMVLNTEIIGVLHETGSRHAMPDSLYGYGIPDLTMAVSILQDKYVDIPEEKSVAGPNPFHSMLEITFREPPEKLRLEIISGSGRLISVREYNQYISRKLIISELQNAEQGLYFIRLVTSNGTFVHKVIKINN